MNLALLLFLVWTALELVFIIGSVVWSIEQGQWKDIEAAKYSMLIDHELAPWPKRKKPAPALPQDDRPAGE